MSHKLVAWLTQCTLQGHSAGPGTQEELGDEQSPSNGQGAHTDIFCVLLQSGFGLVMWWKRKGTSASQSTTPAAW